MFFGCNEIIQNVPNKALLANTFSVIKICNLVHSTPKKGLQSDDSSH